MISIIIPLYNKALSVENTIQSVLNQTFVEFELLIVDDGSTDKSLELVKLIKDSRIKIIEKYNGGVSSARNVGIHNAKFPWLAFLDADDLWDVNHLETLWKMISDYPSDKVFCTSYIRSNQPSITEHTQDVLVIEDYFQEAISKGHFFWTSVTCIHISVFEKVGNFNEQMNRGEDLELWTRIGRKYRFIKSSLITAVYRIEAENRSDLKFNIEKSRLYNYDFSLASGKSEIAYYKIQIRNLLKSLLLKKDFRNFRTLMGKHKKYVSYFDLLKN